MPTRTDLSHITKEVLLNSLHVNEYNQSLVSKDLGIGNASVSRLMYKFELKNKSAPAHAASITKEMLLECVLRHNRSKKKAGLELGIGASTVDKLIEKFGLKEQTKRVYSSAISSEVLLACLINHDWIQTEVAKELNTSDGNIVRLIEQYGLRELSKTGVRERFDNCLNCGVELDSRKMMYCSKKCNMSHHGKVDKIPMLQAYQEMLAKLKPSAEIFELGKTDNNLNLIDFVWRVDNYGYICTTHKYNTIKMHRLIWMYFNGAISEHLVIDHINHDVGDNRLENLRLATRSENSMNQQLQKPKTSIYKGVYFDSDRGKWAAAIVSNKTTYRLGRFDTEIEAAKAYDDAAKIHHKNFAHLNFPDI